MSIDFRSLSSTDQTATTGTDPTFNADDGNWYIVLPRPDGLTVGDMMVTGGWTLNNALGSGVGYHPPTNTGWTINLVGSDEYVAWRPVTEDDLTAPSLQFGPVSAGTGDEGSVFWLVYSGGVKKVSAVLRDDYDFSGTLGVPVMTASVDAIVVAIYSVGGATIGDLSAVGFTERASFPGYYIAPGLDLTGVFVGDFALAAGDSTDPSSTYLSGLQTDGSDPGAFAHCYALLMEGNHPPNTPTVVAPPASATYTTLEDIPLQLTPFADIDPGDTASACGFRYELVSGGTWAPIVGDPETGTGVIPAGTVAAGSWQADGTWTDQSSAESGHATPRTFTVIDPPTAPVITVPTSGATIDAPTASETFTVTASDGYQRQLIGDISGSPDPTVIYADTGLVTASGGQTVAGHYPINNVVAHLRYRIIDDGHYSDWATIPLTVAYTLPDKPVITGITEDSDDAKIVVGYTCAVDSIPSDATSIALWASQDDFATSFLAVTKNDLGDPLPVAAGTAPWHLPASGVDYSFKIRATNAYGAINRSDPDGSTTGTAEDLRTIIVDGGGP